MLLSELNNKNVLIWGFGIEGISIFELIKNKTKNLIVAVKDINEYLHKYVGINFINENDLLNYQYDIVIKSSGISKYKDEMKILQNKGTIITTVQNIFLSELLIKRNNKNFPKVIGITGTKGKSTTCSILNHILNNIGYKSILVGNIGVSVLSILQKLQDYDYIIVELSSYQCAMLENGMLDYAVVLNLFPEHIDWHKNFDNYFNDKLNIINNTQKAIINSNDKSTNKYLINKNNNIIYFNYKNGFYIKNNSIYYNEDFIYNINEFNNLYGKHIFENLCSILTILKLENINIYKSIKTLNTFKTLEHRLEIFYKNKENNFICVNDSISTIPEATIKAIETFNDIELYLILGGYDRNQDYTELENIITNNNNIKKIFLTGSTGKRIFYDFNKINLDKNFEYCETLSEIINKINFSKLKNTAILLSPASASYDNYKNFEERGNLFKKLILEHINKFL